MPNTFAPVIHFYLIRETMLQLIQGTDLAAVGPGIQLFRYRVQQL
jgi:hypothetical protein